MAQQRIVRRTIRWPARCEICCASPKQVPELSYFGGCCIHGVSISVNSGFALVLPIVRPIGIERVLDGCLKELLHIQTVLIWRHLSMLDESPEQSEVHRPAEARNMVMFVRLGPAQVMKPHLSHAVFFV